MSSWEKNHLCGSFQCILLITVWRICELAPPAAAGAPDAAKLLYTELTSGSPNGAGSEGGSAVFYYVHP